MFTINWHTPTDRQVDDLGRKKKQESSGKKTKEACAEWLEQRVGTQYAYADKELQAEAAKESFAFNAYKDAKAILKAKGHKSSPWGCGEPWYFGFGDRSTWKKDPKHETSEPSSLEGSIEG